MLKRAGHLISAAAARPGHKSPQPVSALAAASGTDEPRHLRDRLEQNQVDQIRLAASAGVPRKTLATQYRIAPAASTDSSPENDEPPSPRRSDSKSTPSPGATVRR